VFVQRTLESSGVKHCKSLEGNVWRKVVSTPKNMVLGRDQRFFTVVLSRMDFGNVGDMENVSFCLNNREISDKIYR